MLKFISSTNKEVEGKFQGRILEAKSSPYLTVTFTTEDGDWFRTSPIEKTQTVGDYIVYATKNSTYTFEMLK